MGLIQKLEEIKDIKENIKDAILEKGGVLEDATPFEDYAGVIQNLQTEDETDYTDTNAEYLCYGLSNPNLIKFLCDNIDKNEQNNYYYTFSNCKVDVSDMFKVKKYHKNLAYADSSVIYPYGTNYFFNNMERTFYQYNFSGELDLKFYEYLPTYFEQTFYYCSNLKKLSTNFERIWVGYGYGTFSYCTNLIEVPKIDVEKCTTFYNMFYNCRNLKRVEFTGRPFIKNESNKKLGFGSVSTTPNMNYMFYGCSSLESIKGLDLTYVDSGISISNMFTGCTKLKELDFTGTENLIRLDISSTGLDRDGMMNMLSTLPQLGHEATIKVGDAKLAMLSDEDIAEFTLKGYSLAGNIFLT